MDQHSLFGYWKLCWTKRFFSFEGRARRSEFWGFVLFSYVITHVLLAIGLVALGFWVVALGLSERDLDVELNPDQWWMLGGSVLSGTGLYLLYLGVSLIPLLAVTSRRLHDAGYSAAWMLLWIVPMGNIALLVFTCLDSQPGPNQWGDNPKEIRETPIYDEASSTDWSDHTPY